MLETASLQSLLKSLPDLHVGVVGDFCVDAYWTLDSAASETSLETGLPTRPVREQRYELGGAGTVVNNLISLGVGQVSVFGVVGPDPFGRELLRLLDTKGVHHTGLLTQVNNWNTPVYIKPIRGHREANRLDFGNFNQLRDEIATEFLAGIEAALPALNAVIVNEQIRTGLHTPFVQQRLNQLFRDHAEQMFLLDARYSSDHYDHCLHQLNDHEATRLCGATHSVDDIIPLEEVQAAARQLFERWHKPVFVTRGARGALVADAAGLQVIPGLHIVNPTDPVGAGDSFLAGVAAALATGYSPVEAAAFGNLVAGVTVQKLLQTGTASPEEVLAIAGNPDWE